MVRTTSGPRPSCSRALRNRKNSPNHRLGIGDAHNWNFRSIRVSECRDLEVPICVTRPLGRSAHNTRAELIPAGSSEVTLA